MAVKLYFGLPGCGKTTLMTKFAYDFVKNYKYRNVYSNVPLSIPGVTYIDNDVIGKYALENAAILIDEATLFADNRDHKSFSKERITYFLEHRHFNVDIYLFTQQWDGVDRKIRVITDRVYYVYKTWFLGMWFTEYYRIPYGIIIPDPKQGSEKLGEIIQGYCKPNLLIRLFSHKCFRPKYYKYFDSWSRPAGFSALSSRYQPYVGYLDGEPVVGVRQLESMLKRRQCSKVLILLRSISSRTKSVICQCWSSFRSLFVKDHESVD